ncbi:MAG: MOSC domain-containing protein [Gammaproteobacteria bacterium]|nr:MOSC domain-containing protein [Gammaproteobacteria bacterium]
MTILTPVAVRGNIEALLINPDSSDLVSELQTSVTVDYGGFIGDVHHGETRSACVRVHRQYPRHTEIRNTRQITAVSTEELQAIAESLSIPSIRPEWLGANLVVSGIPKFTQIPPATRLIFDSGTSLVVDMENAPCKGPADVIESHHPGHGKAFPTLALGKRGVTCWVERTGTLCVGDSCSVHTPPALNWIQVQPLV